ncbi:MAG: hypothetical protein ABIW36_12680 [Terrimesophilobacter sp.]
MLGVFTLESLSAFAVGGFAALPIALLPMKMLDGGTLFSWKRWVWAIAYGIGMFLFLLILLPLPSSWGTVTTPFPHLARPVHRVRRVRAAGLGLFPAASAGYRADR